MCVDFLFYPPKLGTSLGQKVADLVCWHVQKSFLFSCLGDELKGAHSGLIASTLMFSIFSFSFLSFYFCVFLIFFFSFAHFHLFLFLWFAHIMNTHIQWYSFIPMDIPIFLYLESPFPNFKRFSSVSKRFPRYSSSFRVHKFSKHSVLISSLVRYEVSSKCSR